MRTVEEQRRAMRNMVDRKAAKTFYQMADEAAGRFGRDGINSRDLIQRQSMLEGACDDSIVDHPEAWDDLPNVEDCKIHLTPSERKELVELSYLIIQLEGGEDWERGVVLIAENDFEDHARDKAADDNIGADLDDWPFNSIDWSQAAYDLQDDYLEGSVDAGTWLIKG